MDPLVPLPNINLTNLTKVYSFSALIVVLVIFSAFFSASETALTCCNRVRIKVKAENGSKAARLAMKLINMYDRSIITLLIGNNIVNILASSLATIVFLVIFRGNDSLASTISTIVMTLLILFFGEVIPKNMAKEKADKFILFSCYPLMLFHILFFPVMFILNLLLKAIKKIFKVDDSQSTMTEDEFQGIVETVEDGQTKEAIELLGDARDKIFDALVEKDGFAFIAVGRPESAGCYCKINSYLKEVISLISNDFDYVVIDGEAGIEQINRRVMEKVTHLMLITDSSRKGTQVVQTIKKVADELVMYEKAGVIINRLPDMEVIQYMDLADLPVLAAIPADASLAEFDLKGENVFYLSEESAIVQGAREALKKIKILDEEGSA